MKKWILLASSAIVYGLALIMSPTFWWCSFICFVPFFYLGSQRNLSYREGFFYSALLWAIGGAGILQTLFLLGQGPLWFRLIAPIGIVLIQALIGGFWFLATSWFLKRTRITIPYARLGILILSTCIYFYYVIHLSLSMFNYWEGYFLLYPLLPLAEYPQVLSAMPFLGKGILLWLLLITNALFTLPWLTTNNLIRYLAPICGMLPWIIQVLIAPPAQKAPSWVRTIATIQKKYNPIPQPMHAIEAIQQDIRTLIQKYPDLDLVILPESALFRLNLDTARELATYWNTVSVQKPIHILLGAFKWENNLYRNTVYWIFDGTLQGSFNKRHPMAVTESVGWYNFSFLRTVFHGSSPTIAASDNPRIPFKIKDVSYVPYVCSELFFNDKPDDHYPTSIITELSNDYWAKSGYIRRLMFLAGRFKAIEWQRPIIYVSYAYQGFIGKDGTISSLKTLD